MVHRGIYDPNTGLNEVYLLKNFYLLEIYLLCFFIWEHLNFSVPNFSNFPAWNVTLEIWLGCAYSLYINTINKLVYVYPRGSGGGGGFYYSVLSVLFQVMIFTECWKGEANGGNHYISRNAEATLFWKYYITEKFVINSTFKYSENISIRYWILDVLGPLFVNFKNMKYVVFLISIIVKTRCSCRYYDLEKKNWKLPLIIRFCLAKHFEEYLGKGMFSVFEICIYIFRSAFVSKIWNRPSERLIFLKETDHIGHKHWYLCVYSTSRI
jgi:hypothetical protein